MSLQCYANFVMESKTSGYRSKRLSAFLQEPFKYYSAFLSCHHIFFNFNGAPPLDVWEDLDHFGRSLMIMPIDLIQAVAKLSSDL